MPRILFSCSILFIGVASVTQAETTDYAASIKPILKARCYACHGAIKQESNLRLDTAEFARQGGDSGPAVVAGDPSASLLLQRISAQDEFERMPPEGKPLTAAEVALIRNWIDSGAAAPANEPPEVDPRQHWAFQPPRKSDVPVLASDARLDDLGVHPIDAFLEQARRRQGLTRVGEADRRLLLRRVYLDLVGFPPTPTEVRAFLDDSQPDAYERVVERLLESPHYGERWGRHWMDVWRYTDWFGLGQQLRYSQKHIWHWRDWIVESLNEDKGYDRMVLEMLAGDEIAPHDPDTLRATGFLARNYFLFNRTTWLDNTIEHTSKAFLGITINCAKCHDHKYDPISQEDYYRMRAFFEPHQVRLDAVPGQIDLEKDGLPRVFDAHPEAPTYLHVRGDEKTPDTSRVILPGVPAMLAFEPLSIRPVELPAEAHRPALQLHVLEDHLRNAESKIAAAEANLEKARTQLKTARQSEPTSGLASPPGEPPPGEPQLADSDNPLTSGEIFLHDNFESWREDLWERGPGEWQVKDGELTQSQVGAQRAYLRSLREHPPDFVARLRFTATGGELWKSVGLSFDATEGREKLVYLSAHAGGPKLQISYNRGEGHVYPPGAAQMRPVALNEEHEIMLAVRGKRVNASVNGGDVLAYDFPIDRKAGRIDLIAFDAAVTFHDLEIRHLPPSAALVAPASPSAGEGLTLEQARAALEAAEKKLAQAKLHPEALRASHRAARAEAGLPLEPASDHTLDLAPDVVRREAAMATLQYQIAEAEYQAADLQRQLLTADQSKQAGLSKQKEQTLANLDKLRKSLDAAQPAVGDKTNNEQAAEKLSYLTLRASLKALEGPDESDTSRKQPYPAQSTGRRTALGRWITDSRNPLTARVAVNHIWMRHFGQPLVEPVTDFGRRTEAPPLQPLLDWLAVELMEEGWRMKPLHRLIVTSQAYRLSSSNRDAAADTLTRDPDNRYFWRRPTQRMESEAIRDSMLILAGTLDPQLGGATIDPRNSDNVFRRSLYFTHSRDDQHPFLTMFDDADIVACYRRSTSIVPQQALALSNSKLALSMARRIADNLADSGSFERDSDFARAAYEMILVSAPTEEELAACVEALQDTRQVLNEQGHPEPGQGARQNLVHALLNHNDFVTIR